MKAISGFTQDRFLRSLNNEVGILLYQEFPVTIVYHTNDQSPVIKEWVDCEDDVDRYFVYETTTKKLREFINGELSHYDVIQSCKGGLVVLFDEIGSKIKNITISSPASLPVDYMPAISSFFKKANGVDTDDIIKFFSLESDVNQQEFQEEPQIDLLKSLAKTQKTDVFNLYIRKGKGVGHGRIDSETFAETLLTFNNLYKEFFLDYYSGKNRATEKIKKDLKKQRDLAASTEVILSKAASFSVFIRPKASNANDLFDKIAMNEKITHNLFDLIGSSLDSKSLERVYGDYSDFVFKSYLDFLKSVITHDIKVDINWSNSNNETLLNETFTLVKATEITNRIASISDTRSVKFTAIGRFKAINCKSGSIIFLTNDEKEVNGRFGAEIKDSMWRLNFSDAYQIFIERVQKKLAGKQSVTIVDTIRACSVIEDDLEDE